MEKHSNVRNCKCTQSLTNYYKRNNPRRFSFLIFSFPKTTSMYAKLEMKQEFPATLWLTRLNQYLAICRKGERIRIPDPKKDFGTCIKKCRCQAALP